MDAVSKILAHDTWATSDGVLEVGPFVLRFRTPVVRASETGNHVHRLIVCWPYADEGDGAMPDGSDVEAMSVFEDSLCDAWEQDALALLAAVLTFDGARQWVFYTRDVSACGERLNLMPQEEEPYPIELTAADDPDWSYLRDQILGTVNWKASQDEWERALADRGGHSDA
jgi:hypothetical protein